MSPDQDLFGVLVEGPPRASGDEPALTKAEFYRDQSAPRQRG